MTKKDIEEFLKNVSTTLHLSPTQKKICVPKIQKNLLKLAENSNPPPIKVNHGRIIEGHHRYLAGMIFGQLPGVIPWGAPSIVTVFEWNQIIVEDDDWDNPSPV